MHPAGVVVGHGDRVLERIGHGDHAIGVVLLDDGDVAGMVGDRLDPAEGVKGVGRALAARVFQVFEAAGGAVPGVGGGFVAAVGVGLELAVGVVGVGRDRGDAVVVALDPGQVAVDPGLRCDLAGGVGHGDGTVEVRIGVRHHVAAGVVGVGVDLARQVLGAHQVIAVVAVLQTAAGEIFDRGDPSIGVGDGEHGPAGGVDDGRELTGPL